MKREEGKGWNIEKNFRPFRNSVDENSNTRSPILSGENLRSDPRRLFQYSPNQSNSIVFNKHANRQDDDSRSRRNSRKIKNVILFLCLRPSLPPFQPPSFPDALITEAESARRQKFFNKNANARN